MSAKPTPGSDALTLPTESSGRVPAREGSAATQSPGAASVGEHTTAPPRKLGEYEIHAELARGGMGVVYKARHTKLDRLVALKMILAGQLASQADVQRFYVEAEAAARLDHAGIVPIYEIGAHEGQHFFTMKLVEGGDLHGRMAELRKSPREASALLAKVARAVQHAHERGILHRDLKPSNVLLDEHGEPLVTDFGLAKHIEGDSALTQTGAILGTPAYMPPEQAAGQPVTTAADIYSLGAMLYELLTGRPPYCADSPVSTMVKLLAGPPPAPREIDSKLDRDLELICLKCLAREPAERYATAGALAADLENQLAGRPLSIRPPALATVFQIWFRENVRAVAWTGVIGVGFGLLIGLAIYFAFLAGEFGQLSKIYDRLPNLERPLLAVDWSVPHWLEILCMVGLLLLMVYLGLVTAAVVRPTSRQAALAAGLGVGVLAAITSFTVSIAWGPIFAAAIDATRHDQEILAQAAFREGDASENRHIDRLLYRYPDFENIPPRQRGPALLAKLRTDMSSGVMLGVWIAMLAALGVGLGPGVGGTMGAYTVLREFGSVRRAVIPYTEAAIVATGLGGLFMFCWFAPMWIGIRLPLWLFAVALVVFALAFYGIVIRGWRWWWRLPLHAAWIATVAFMFVHEGRASRLAENLNRQIQSGQFEAAAETLERLIKRNPENDFYQYQAAALYLHLGDETRYQDLCQSLLERSKSSDDPAICERAAKVSLATPRGLTERAEAFERAARAVKLGGGHDYAYWFELARGMSAYRQGEWQDAVTWLDRALQGNNRYASPLAHLFRAMALAELGEHTEAKGALFAADKSYAEAQAWLIEQGHGPYGAGWHDAFIFELNRKESESLFQRLR